MCSCFELHKIGARKIKILFPYEKNQPTHTSNSIQSGTLEVKSAMHNYRASCRPGRRADFIGPKRHCLISPIMVFTAKKGRPRKYPTILHAKEAAREKRARYEQTHKESRQHRRRKLENRCVTYLTRKTAFSDHERQPLGLARQYNGPRQHSLRAS